MSTGQITVVAGGRGYGKTEALRLMLQGIEGVIVVDSAPQVTAAVEIKLGRDTACSIGSIRVTEVVPELPRDDGAMAWRKRLQRENMRRHEQRARNALRGRR